MNRIHSYLQLPPPEIGKIRWSSNGDAIERTDGPTFVLSQQVFAFLEGFLARRPLMHFWYVLHLLHLLRNGRPLNPKHNFVSLTTSWREVGRPARTVGVFAGVLCAEIPVVVDPPSLEMLRASLIHGIHRGNESDLPIDPPQMSMEQFEGLVHQELNRFSHEEILHWLTQGQAPLSEEINRIAEEILNRPASMEQIVEEVCEHDRLHGAIRHVPHLLGALSLPPRPMFQPELPLGGYSDVATRGQPEHLLPAQFALDDLEFLRRHTHNELLYYRREEPVRRMTDPLILIVDLGVRTWGPIRLAVAGCVLALMKMSEGLSLQISTTGIAGELIDPFQVTAKDLGDILTTTDFSVDPSETLLSLREQLPNSPVDLILLTHPRSLDRQEVKDAVRTLPSMSRLFVVTIGNDGEVLFREMKPEPGIPISKCRLQLNEPTTTTQALRWTGDVEPVGFPFRFGPPGSPESSTFCFDLTEEWILLTGLHGMLHLQRTNGTNHEILPRPYVEGEILVDVRDVLPVQNGFLVLGHLTKTKLVLAYYQLPSQQCRVMVMSIPPSWPFRWFEYRYFLPRHLFLLYISDRLIGFDLSTQRVIEDVSDELKWTPGEVSNTPREWNYFITRNKQAYKQLDTLRNSPMIRFDSRRGILLVENAYPPWSGPFTPLADGKPLLAGYTLVSADLQGHILAVRLISPSGYHGLFLFESPQGKRIGSIGVSSEVGAFLLSCRGKYLGVQQSNSQVVLREPRFNEKITCSTPIGRFHNNIQIRLYPGQLMVHIGSYRHSLNWQNGELVVDSWETSTRVATKDDTETRSNESLTRSLPSCLTYDQHRFREVIGLGNLTIALSRFGEIFLVSAFDGLLLGAFFVIRQHVAGWMPDGTTFGSAVLTGKVPTPGAAQNMGRCLLMATQTIRRNRE